MTRANLNFVYQKQGQAPQTYYWYHNGDQYPRGLRDFYNVKDFIKSDWSLKSFQKWIGENYKIKKAVTVGNPTGVTLTTFEDSEAPAKAYKVNSPCIFYDDGNFIADYSYVFDHMITPKVLVYNWADKIFEGTPEEFIKWLNKQK